MPHLGPIFAVFKIYLHNQWSEFNSNYKNLVWQKVSYVRPSIVLDNYIIVIELFNLKVQKKISGFTAIVSRSWTASLGSYKELKRCRFAPFSWVLEVDPLSSDSVLVTLLFVCTDVFSFGPIRFSYVE